VFENRRGQRRPARGVFRPVIPLERESGLDSGSRCAWPE
jgi:hypothetical protein